ncbi:MAG: hypothetical protein JXX29_05030 [Deltaproteobacteria bacterium]|nr:hypothetical protein [Deltaproteobacteria bacterium]MBN2671010.1 hypothetical protein [Deltaproteobacteria bacterium]
MHMRICALFLFLLLGGCGAIVQHDNYPIQTYPTVPVAQTLDAYVAVGIHMNLTEESIVKLSEMLGTEQLLAILMMGYVGGNRLEPWGLVHHTYAGEVVPRIWAGGSSSYNGSHYVRSDANGRNYLIFKVPAAYFQNPSNSVIFMGAYHTQSGGWIRYKLRQWPAKSFALPVDAGAYYAGRDLKEQPDDIFSAWAFPISRSAVYYLGEIVIGGTILAKDMPMNETGKAMLGTNDSMYIITQRVGSIVDQAKTYLGQTTLKDMEVIDVSNTFQSIPTADFPYYKSGKK